MARKTIFKYRLEITDAQQVEMPEDAEILTAQFQGDTLCLWAVVNPDNEREPRTIAIFGTGNPVTCGEHQRQFIATAQMPGKPLVWHVFETWHDHNT